MSSSSHSLPTMQVGANGGVVGPCSTCTQASVSPLTCANCNRALWSSEYRALKSPVTMTARPAEFCWM
ncbi:Uncharacterised protein [Mycobacterium tuberculosis]|nr:Uncharacterised protein [Mycobacterium tuberculosis]